MNPKQKDKRFFQSVANINTEHIILIKFLLRNEVKFRYFLKPSNLGYNLYQNITLVFLGLRFFIKLGWFESWLNQCQKTIHRLIIT